jgi:RNA recognition motif-containing protein|uniref:RRM domain-containing protein n=1 Tax=Gadus morhua TaxID=8049 RepID=A0A8C5AK39_GADMO
MNKLYVGNLSPSVTVEDLKQLFCERDLPVADQVLLKSGYGFVDFPDQNWAIKAIETLSGEYRLDCMDDAAVTGIHIESGLDMQQQYLGTNL